MADIRCPMCGKSNPGDRETCQYCQARLKPLVAGAPSEPQTPPSPSPGKPDLGASPGKPDLEKREVSSLASPASSTGDWLSDFRSDEPVEAGPEESDASSGSSDFGDWFSRLEEPAEAEPAEPAGQPTQPEEEVFPDWLSGTAKTPAPPAEQGAESDWMQQFQAQPTEGTAPGSEKSPEEAGTVGATDWLSGLGSLAAPGAEEARPTEFEEELPDWMKPVAEPGTFQQPGLSQEESLPDWMHEVGGEPAAGEPSEIETGETAKPAVFGEIPDWLQSQMPPGAQEETPPLSAETGPEQEIDWSQAETPGNLPTGVPDWLAEASTPTGEAFTGPAETLSEPGVEESPTDWFTKLGVTPEEKPVSGMPAFVMSDNDLSPFVSGDEMAAGSETGDLESLPDWLSQVSAEQPSPAPEAPPLQAAPPPELEPQAETGLAPAQLPTWLEAMRPVESAAPTIPTAEEGPSTIEAAGPLAGLRGILPAEAEITRIRKPPVYSVKLQLSEAHQARVSLLEELVASEGRPKPVAPHVAIASQTALRLAIALFLILAVFGALWMGSEWTPLPDPQSVPQALEDLRGQIEALSANLPVLVAFDYDPGFSGEMEASASAVISHLVEKRVPLAFVSTNPLGPALAERLVKRQVDELNSQLLPGTSPYTTTLFANLGYIPGGIAGLRAFAETPTQIFPVSLDGQEFWTTTPLTSSTTLAGFALAMVITDNPDTARAWIEQAEPAMKPSPLLMIVSAQAEPMILPYYDSGQVQGMMAGLAGGAAYENKRGRSGLASQSWDAFSASLLVATILILIGGLVNASLATIASNKRKGEEQPYA